MAEVKPIPSAVGAFEAQVFNLTRTANVIQQQEAQRRRLQADARKEAEKALSEMGTLMAKGRKQDLPYLQQLYSDVTSYYSQNAGSLKPGTAEYNKFNELKAKFNFESQRSIGEKETDKDFANFMAVNSEKQKISDGSLEAWSAKQLPINDPKRAQFRFKKRDGSEAPIDEIGLPDLQKYDRYDENETRKDIQGVQNIDIQTENFVRNYKGTNVPFGSIKETTLRFKPPSQILQTFDTRYASSLDAESFYDNAWNNLSQKEKDDMNTLFSKINDVYRAAGINEKITLDEKDGVKGISNGYEFGAAKFLLDYMPMQVKENLNLQLAGFYETQEYRRRSFALRNALKVKENLDTSVAKSILEPGFSLTQYGKSFDSGIGESSVYTGTKYKPVAFESANDKDKTITWRTNFPVAKDEKPVKDFKTAQSITGLDNDPKNPEYLTKDKFGNWFKTSRRTYNLNPNVPGYELRVIDMNNDIENALRESKNEAMYNSFRGLRGVGARMTEVTGQAQDIILDR
jgi:hypothetical protein